MQNRRHAPVRIRTGKKAGIWLSLVVALGLHAILLLMPVTRQTPPAERVTAQIELQLTTFTLPAPEIEPLALEPEPEPEPVPIPEPERKIVESQPVIKAPVPATLPPARELEQDPHSISEQQLNRLTDVILSRQFITEESASDQLFGKQLQQASSEFIKEFHYPVRQDMIAMLDQPMPEVPFAYTPGLIHFAYDPGFKGELQRFWDVITPEFGWITNNGTEFKCVWVLVIGACGWK